MLVALGPANRSVILPSDSSFAAAGTLPIYRTCNQRPDINHRYTMDGRVQTIMMGSGYVPEGCGNPPVAMCSPQ